MKKAMSLFLFLVTILGSSSVFALNQTDQNAINHIVDHFTNAWNHHHGKGSADYYADDADFVNIFGMAFSGKQEIENRHVKIHETFLRDSTFEVVDLKVREANPGVAIAHVFWKVEGFHKPGSDSPKDTKTGVFTHTFVKNDGKWEIASTQNTLIAN